MPTKIRLLVISTELITDSDIIFYFYSNEYQELETKDEHYGRIIITNAYNSEHTLISFSSVIKIFY